MLESLFKIFTDLQASNFIQETLQNRCFPVNAAKFLRAPILRNIWQWLFLVLWNTTPCLHACLFFSLSFVSFFSFFLSLFVLFWVFSAWQSGIFETYPRVFGSNGPEMRFFRFHEKFMCWVIKKSFFFGGGDLAMRVFAKRDPSFRENQCIEFFLFFALCKDTTQTFNWRYETTRFF